MGSGWLTERLIAIIKNIRYENLCKVYPVSFGVYKDDKLKAGEFGIICGKVYSSYSGYYEESNAGKVQMILTASYLRDNAFSFWDLGMPIPYKNKLGAKDIDFKCFIDKFRKASQEELNMDWVNERVNERIVHSVTSDN